MSLIESELQPGRLYDTSIGKVTVSPYPDVQPETPCLHIGWSGSVSVFGTKCPHYVLPDSQIKNGVTGCRVVHALAGNEMALKDEEGIGQRVANEAAIFLNGARVGINGNLIQCTVFERK